jgi:hypothetical protein
MVGVMAVDLPAFRASLSGSAPPAGLTPPVTALWWLAKGGLKPGEGLEKAHEIAQSNEGEPAHDWVHALVHRIEGDAGNAGYWYRRAGKVASSLPVEAEWTEMATTLLGDGS